MKNDETTRQQDQAAADAAAQKKIRGLRGLLAHTSPDFPDTRLFLLEELRRLYDAEKPS